MDGDGGWRLGHRPALDGVRGLAVLMVLSGHYRLPGYSTIAGDGVELFLLLSGFLITSLLIEERQNTGAIDLLGFYRRRTVRLIPALVVLLAFVALCTALGRFDAGPATAGTLSTLAYANNWLTVAGHDLDPLGHLWSLSVEEHFYLLWPAAVLVAMRGSRRQPKAGVLLAAITLGMIAFLQRVRYFHPQDIVRFSYGSDTRALSIAAGCALAVVFHVERLRRPLVRALRSTALLVGVGGLVLFGVTAIVGDAALTHSDWWWWSLLLCTPAAAALLLAVLVDAPLLTAALSSWPMRWMGRLSYAVYLWHVPVKRLIGPGYGWRSVSAAVLTVAVAWVSYVIVEQPALRRWKRPVAAADAPAALPVAAAVS